MQLHYPFDQTTKLIKRLPFLTVITLTMLTGCKNKNPEKEPVAVKTDLAPMPFYVGTYTDGDSEGIYEYELSGDGKLSKIRLAAKTSNPSYIDFNIDKTILLAVSENDSGTVQSFSIHQDSLHLISEQSSGGTYPCFLKANAAGFILTANYGSGGVGLLRLDDQGKLSYLLDVDEHSGRGPTDRQTGPHAHSVAFLPDDNKILEVDLGTDQLWFSILDTTINRLKPATPRTLDMPKGSGPRHYAFHPKKKIVYILDELGSSITAVDMAQDDFKVMNTYSTLPKEYTEDNTGAELAVTKDGKFLYASNRGLNSIATFKIMEDGSLNLVKNTPTKGKMPRNFSLSPNEDFMVVANQDSNSLVAFKRDQETGLLTYTSETKAPKPVCVLFK